MPVNINRGTTNVINDPEISQEIWGAALEESFFMSHARRITLPGEGVKIQTITGEPTANWVAETTAKPVSTHTFGTKTITPYKLAVIEPFSDEFVRDKRALYDELVRRLPNAIARKFDATILSTSAPGTGFDVLTASTAVGIGGTGTYKDRLTTAYCTGGIDQLANTLAYNFGVEIDNFVEVDFEAFITIIDALGGIDIELTEVQDKLVSLVEAVFALLSTLGIVVDQPNVGGKRVTAGELGYPCQ